jgi:hypothetical protein
MTPFMKPSPILLTALLLAPLTAVPVPLPAAELTVHSPLDYQVVQRSSPGKGLLRFVATL